MSPGLALAFLQNNPLVALDVPEYVGTHLDLWSPFEFLRYAPGYPPPDDESAATGIGRSVRNDVQWVHMDLDPKAVSEVTIRYEGQGATTLTPDPNTFPLTLDSALGSFVIERPATSTADDVVIAKTGFEITITQTRPWAATTTLEGTFQGSVDTTATTVKATFALERDAS